ncbi:MAG: hypothetical protein IPN26_15845 [Bacteroidetes bacterium]|nr:hypothetical protein [Bacteroidota bacterium]
MQIKYLFLFCFFSITQTLFAQESYVYIEGMKGIPFYLIHNGKTVPSMGKNYVLCPIPQSGEQQIDIAFNGDLFPKQQFVLDAVPGSAFAFKLAKTAEDKFYLIDLVNTGKIVETNTAVNMALSTSINQIKFAQIIPDETKVEKEIESTESNKEKRRRRKQELAEQQETLVQNSEQKTPDSNGVVQIITAQPAEAPQKIETPAPVKPVKQEPVCKRQASESEISNTIDKLKQKNDDDTKLLILKRRDFTGCVNVEQVNLIAGVFDTQYGRYGAIKFLRNFTSNPEKLSDLDYLFKSNSYKEKLKTLF